jgi:Raf kinase inhibitor-like YbhB/YbcL family protein
VTLIQSRARPAIATVVVAMVVAAGCGPGSGSVASFEASTPVSSLAASSSAAPSEAAASAPSPSGPEASGSTATAGVSPTMTPSPTPTAARFRLTSTAFEAGAPIPRAATCDGVDRSPALAWSGVPAGAAALVLVVDDPDAHEFTHWLVLDLPGAANGSLPAGVVGGAAAPQQGRNDFGRVGYGGPCPPSGTHHYRFTLIALAAPLALPGHPGGDAVRAALRSAKVLGTTVLTGTYRR